jgi:NADH dehydrogenase [ubiquinone] 1 alpha subcomplex assembly factor 7
VSALKQKLLAQIAQTGPMTIAEFMAACLYDPQHGYYATRPQLGGADADFVTAPEASQMFGELIGLWCVHEWEAIGAPTPVQWIELGPGRGVLMEDARRATAKHTAFREAAQLTLVDTSGPLRAAQAERLPDAKWSDRLEDTPPGPALIVANEFLDCMPIRQFIRIDDAWRENCVGANWDGDLSFGLGPPITPPIDDRAGEVQEYAAALAPFVEVVAKRLHTAPGRALFVDYGYAKPGGADTLQAMKAHRHVDPLQAPGEADMTALVDFSALTRLAKEAGLDVAGPIGQGDFLRALGVKERAAALTAAHPERAERMARELQRLTSDGQMGALFLVACLSSPGLPPPAGF